MLLRRLREADLEQSWELDREAFNVPKRNRERFLAGAVAEEFVGAFDAERLVAQSRALSLGQFFGGRSVPMGGLSSVSSAPDHRGRGLGKRVVRGCLELMHERGDAISSLFPATTDLYRRLGWELAGTFVFRTVAPAALAALPAPDRVGVRRVEPDAAREKLRALYEALAPSIEGFLDRPPARWEHLMRQWSESSFFLAEDASGAAVGYLVYTAVPGRYGSFGGPFQLSVEECLAATHDATLALWRLLGSWVSQVEQIIYRGPAEDPLLLTLPQQEIKVLEEIRWMTRMVDAARAVEARGFPPGLEAEAHLALRDELLPANDGRFVLRVAKGRGRLDPGGDGELALDVGSFSSLYTGWANTATLARCGRLSGGTRETRTALDAAFSGPTPWMPEQF
jgi:predicted acetyltransferase